MPISNSNEHIKRNSHRYTLPDSMDSLHFKPPMVMISSYYQANVSLKQISDSEEPDLSSSKLLLLRSEADRSLFHVIAVLAFAGKGLFCAVIIECRRLLRSPYRLLIFSLAVVTFSTHRGQFQWKVMPFGLTNGPASFTRLMNLALDGLTWIYCLVYLDDIIVWSAIFYKHLHRLRQVFDRIRKAGLKLKPAKCQFLKKRVTFLGHVVSSQGIETDPEKTRDVDEWPTPENLVELQSFLGLASYYRRFIADFSIIAEPLYRLSKKGIRFLWGPEQRRAFEELKHRLTSAPVLAYPDFSPGAGTFVLDTYASQRLGIGAVLSQVQSDGTERVVAYGSRSLNEHERNYCTTRLEMLALVTYVDHFRNYLAGCKFLLRTDHHSLKWLMSFREPEGQIARWLERLQEYDFEVEHRPGKSHCNADVSKAEAFPW